MRRVGFRLCWVALLWTAACSPPAAVRGTATAPSLPPASPTPMANPTRIPATQVLPGIELATEAADVEFVIPPTIQHAWPGGAALVFELSEEREIVVLVDARDGAGWQIVERLPAAIRQMVWLTHLAEGAVIHIAVAVPDAGGSLRLPEFLGGPWGPLRLRVPEWNPARIRIVVMGDSGYGDDVTPELAAAAARWEPDATIHTGDLVYRAEEEGSPLAAYQEKFYSALSPLLEGGPVYPVLGNHELDGPVRHQGASFYYTAFPTLAELCCTGVVPPERREWYSVAWGAWQFVFLNSQAFFGHGDRAQQDTWLDQRLADPTYRHSVAVMHVAAFSAGLHRSDGAPLRSAWHPRFAAAAVPLALSGHDHNYQRWRVDDVTYLVSGGGSAVLYGRSAEVPGNLVFDSRSHFLLLDLEPQTLTIQSIASDGAILDAFVLP